VTYIEARKREQVTAGHEPVRRFRVGLGFIGDKPVVTAYSIWQLPDDYAELMEEALKESQTDMEKRAAWANRMLQLVMRAVFPHWWAGEGDSDGEAEGPEPGPDATGDSA